MSTANLYIFLAILTSASCTGALIPVIIAFCRKYGFYDQPDQRKVHHQAIPRLGGLSFLPATAVGTVVAMLIYIDQTHYQIDFSFSAVWMVLGSVVIYMIGLLDDLLDLHATTKFLVLLGCSLLLPLCSLTIGDVHGLFGANHLPLWQGFPITVLVILTIVNAINLIDGIDGLASGISIICLVVYIILFKDLRSPFFMIVAAALAGSVVMFFFFNVFGRERGMKIFMGDAGSLILGYVLSYLAIKAILVSEQDVYFMGNPLLIPYSLFIVPVFDLVRVFFTRLLTGQPVFKADKRHIHHVLMNYGFSMHASLVAILLLVLFFLFVNIAFDQWGITLTFIFLVDVLLFASFFLTLWGLQCLRKTKEK